MSECLPQSMDKSALRSFLRAARTAMIQMQNICVIVLVERGPAIDNFKRITGRIKIVMSTGTVTGILEKTPEIVTKISDTSTVEMKKGIHFQSSRASAFKPEVKVGAARSIELAMSGDVEQFEKHVLDNPGN